MNSPSEKQKIEMYESFLHKINAFVVCSNNEGIKELVENADNWSYAHRIGNGEPSDEEQQEIIDRAFWKLLDTPRSDKKTQERQKFYADARRQLNT